MKALKFHGIHPVGFEHLKVMFYSTSCPFSIKSAPVFNSLPTLFPSGLVVAAIEAPRKWTIEHGPGPAEFGVLGTPSIILFYGRKEIARYNDSIIELKRLYEWTKSSTKLKSAPLGNGLLHIGKSWKTHPEFSEISVFRLVSLTVLLENSSILG